MSNKMSKSVLYTKLAENTSLLGVELGTLPWHIPNLDYKAPAAVRSRMPSDRWVVILPDCKIGRPSPP